MTSLNAPRTASECYLTIPEERGVVVVAGHESENTNCNLRQELQFPDQGGERRCLTVSLDDGDPRYHRGGAEALGACARYEWFRHPKKELSLKTFSN